MSETIKFTVLGDPKTQKRHRSVRMGSHIRQYDPSAADKGDFLSIVQRNAPATPFNVPLKVQICLFFSRPNSHFGTGKNSGVLKSTAPLLHISKPDLDNSTKFVMDALNKVFWRDDSIICQLVVNKTYDNNPRTEILISPAVSE